MEVLKRLSHMFKRVTSNFKRLTVSILTVAHKIQVPYVCILNQISIK